MTNMSYCNQSILSRNPLVANLLKNNFLFYN